MRMGTRKSATTTGISVCHQSSDSLVSTEDIEILHIDKEIVLNVPLEENNVRVHTVKKAPKDKSERHVKHDDCCGYCERFCKNKITNIKRHEIEAWRQDVGVTMAQKQTTHMSHIQRTKKPKIIFPTYQAPGSPDSEPGFRRIKTPRDLRIKKDKSVLSPQRKGGSKKPKRTIDVADMTKVYAQVADMSVQGTSHSGITTDNGPPLLPVHRSSLSNYSHDSLDEDEQSDELSVEELKIPSSQHSYRSCSNELLNVLTIDDAIRKHRDKLLNNHVIKTADPTRRRRHGDVTAPQLLDNQSSDDTNNNNHIVPAPSVATDNPDPSIATDNPDEDKDEREFRLHPDSAHTRNISKFSTTNFEPNNEMALENSFTVSQNYAHSPNGSRLPNHSRLGTSSTGVDYARHVLLHTDQTNDSTYPTKKESKRFQKMHKNLQQLMHREFLPDYRMMDRLQKHKDKRIYSPINSRGPAHSAVSSIHKDSRVSSSWASPRPTAAKGTRKPPMERNLQFSEENTVHMDTTQNNTNFLALLAEYKESEPQ